MVVRYLLAVGPYPHWRTGGVAIAFELFFAIFELGLFYLDQDVRGVCFVFVEDANVGTFFSRGQRSLRIPTACAARGSPSRRAAPSRTTAARLLRV